MQGWGLDGKQIHVSKSLHNMYSTSTVSTIMLVTLEARLFCEHVHFIRGHCYFGSDKLLCRNWCHGICNSNKLKRMRAFQILRKENREFYC